MHGVVQQALATGAILVDVLQGADDAVDLAVAAEHRLNSHAEGAEAAIVSGKADIGRDLAAAQFDQGVEGGAEAVAILGVHAIEPALDRAAQRAAAFAEAGAEFIGDGNAVALDVPVIDEVARAGERQGAALDFGEGADRHLPFREGVLHRGEAQQHDDEHQAAGHRRLRDVVRDLPGDHQPGVEQPGDIDDPGRHQQHGAIIAAQRQQQDQEEAGDAEQRQHQASDGGGDRGLEEGKAEQRQEHHDQRQRQMDEAQVPAMEVEVDEQEAEQSRGDAGLGSGPERLHGAVGNAQQWSEHAEIDQQVDQHSPREGRGGREDAAALDHEHDGEEHRGQRRDTQHHAAEQGERVHVVAVGVGLPEVKFGQRAARQLGDEGDGGAGVDHHLEDVGLAVGEARRAEAGARGEHLDAFGAEIGAEHAGARQAEIRGDQQTLELHVGIVAQREQRPVRVGAADRSQHFDAADDAVFACRGGQLHLAGIAGNDIDHAGEVHRVDVLGGGDDIEGGSGKGPDQRKRNPHREVEDVTH